MKLSQWACAGALALSASTAGAAADTPVVLDENINFSNHILWESPDLPYARLLGGKPASLAHRALGEVRQVSLAAARPAPPAPAVQPLPPLQAVTPVPEASMVSMLLVGLGLLALSVHGEKQDKFDA